MKSQIIIASILLISACSQNQQAENTTNDSIQTDTVEVVVNPYEKATFEVKTFPVEAGGFGYDIYINGAKTIHQPHPPGVAGNEGFKTEEQAKKTAEFVISKIKRNEMPPSVSMKDLDSLGVLN